jgi:hypothetical protein
MITDRQVRKLQNDLGTGMALATAAVRAGMSEKTARKYRNMTKLPSEARTEHSWRTRIDPFESVWADVQQLLEQTPGLQPKTIFRWLQRQHPGKFQQGQLRTLQRRIKQWRATSGPAKEKSLLRSSPLSRRPVCIGLHAHGIARRYDRRPELRPHALPFRVDLLELGIRLALLLRKLREPEPGISGCDRTTRLRPETASHRPAQRSGQQLERNTRLHCSLSGGTDRRKCTDIDRFGCTNSDFEDLIVV